MSTEERAEELWDKYSEHIDDNLFSLERIAGSSVITESQFKKAILDFAAASQPKHPTDEEVEPFENYPELAKTIEWFANNVLCPSTEWNKLLREINKVAKSALQSQPSDPVDGWISVVDRLPDYDVPVLWYLEDGIVLAESLDKDGNPWLFPNEAQQESDNVWGETSKATHWQPLPVPPRNKR